MKPSTFLLSFLFAWLHVSCSAAQRYNAIFSFGDSLSDVGNYLVDGPNDMIDTTKPPYGMTYFGRPTGRCSNGRILMDFIADALKLPFVPPSRAHNQSFHQGANFAMTGATALDVDFFQPKGIGKFVWCDTPMNVQINEFEQMKSSLCNSTESCRDFFAKSLFVFGEFGGNDYNAYFFAGRDTEEATGDVPKVVQAIAKGVERLIGNGAVDIVVPGMLPIGCFPLYLTLFSSDNPADYGPRTGCLKKYNTFVWNHNAMLRAAVENLRRMYPGVRIVYADYYSPAMQFLLNPHKYGFSHVLRACCGAKGKRSYNFKLERRCGMPGAKTCKKPDTYLSWDGVHLTEAAYRFIADGWLKGPYADPPILSSRGRSEGR